MTTSLDDIKTGNQLPVDDNESQLVNEILNEMNQTDSHTLQQPPIDQVKIQNVSNESVNFLQHQMDPNINMSNLDLSMANTSNMKPNEQVVVKNLEVKTSIIDKLKEPLLILVISFILNSPIITSNIYKIMPKMLTNSINGIHLGIKYLGVFIQSLLISLIFMLFKTFVLN